MNEARLRSLPPGAIAPRGWLRDQLQLQADGLTGRLEEVWPDVGPNSGWLGGSGESWERGPYYLDGLVPLAWSLDDVGLKHKASKWIEWMLASQRPDGWFGPAGNDDWWTRMVALKVLMQYAEATDDPRVVPFMQRYFAYQRAALPERPLQKWAVARGQENILAILWLHERAPDPALASLAATVLSMTVDWGTYLTEDLVQGPATRFSHLTHVVNVAMGLKLPALREMLGEQGQRDLLNKALANLDRLHGQATGMFSGDEWLAGNSPHHGTELCAVVETMFSLEVLARIYGSGVFGDRLERVAFNALAATVTADMTAHQYHQQPNQVLATIARRDWTYSSDAPNIFGLEPHFGCCTANLHQGWPKLATSLWAEDAEGGLAAIAYAPCLVRGRAIGLDVSTDYPFDETVAVRVTEAASGARRLSLRVPAWCDDARLTLNGEDLPVAPADGIVVLSREWKAGDTVTLRLPMPVRVETRLNGAVSLHIGPLTLAYCPGEIWRGIPDTPGLGDWEVMPRGSWNYGLETEAGAVSLQALVERRPPSRQPFALATAPVRVMTKGRFVKEWRLEDNSAAPPPPSPVTSNQTPRPITLIPYGCARLRICEFPRLEPQEFTGYVFD
ncbi:beta-L-arabinofuranosidase domain-containing protein [Roseomonas elaeocarpi]|uniref:Beta-L-arabinofuranosidase domain-containing protein n=1 Tax=Roseomonas elaeocarpi TaxID=907779 RepID=A0ABV6JM79_9PROT